MIYDKRFAVLIITFFLFAASCSDSPLLDEAQLAFNTGNFAEADRVLEHLLFTEPANTSALKLACRVSIAGKHGRGPFHFMIHSN